MIFGRLQVRPSDGAAFWTAVFDSDMLIFLSISCDFQQSATTAVWSRDRPDGRLRLRNGDFP